MVVDAADVLVQVVQGEGGFTCTVVGADRAHDLAIAITAIVPSILRSACLQL